MPKYWLVKSEPTTFSFEDLLKAPKQTTAWEGVRNYQARNFMRDEMKMGDPVIFYHSSCDIPAAIGLAEVAREGYLEIDPWVMVDLKAKKPFKREVTRDLMKADKRLDKVMVLQKGSRLSIQPLTPKEFEAICEIGEKN